MAVYPERRGGRLTGKWIAEVTQHGERRRKRFDTKLEGDRWADFIAATGNLPEATAVATAGPTFAEVATKLRASNPERETSSDTSGRYRLSEVVERLGALPIAAVTTTHLDELIIAVRKRRGRTKQPLSAGTINRYLSAASSVLHYAQVRGLITASPTVPWQEDDGKRLVWLTEAQEDDVCARLTPECSTVVRVLTQTGMRWGELAGLKPENVDLTEGYVRLWATKNGEQRSVPITHQLGEELLALVISNRLPKYYTFRKSFKGAAKSAGLSADVCIHSLRHTTATRLTQQGVPLQIVQKYLGHKTITTTTKYSHVADSDLKNALKKLPQHAGQTGSTIIPLPEKDEEDQAGVAELVDARDLGSRS